MQDCLTSRFSDYTIKSDWSHTSYTMTNCSEDEDMLLPAFDMVPQPPPRHTSISPKTKSKKASTHSQRDKPISLRLEPFLPLRLAAVEEQQYDLDVNAVQEDYFNHKALQQAAMQTAVSNQRKCFCGSLVFRDEQTQQFSEGSSNGIYCSRRCARQDALNALEGSSPGISDMAEDEDYPITPSNQYFAPSWMNSQGSRQSYTAKRNASVGSSHYRRMEALGMYDDSPTRRNSEVAARLLSLSTSPARADYDSNKEYNPRHSLFLPVPVYLNPSP